MDKKEAIKQISDKVEQASRLMQEATTLAEKYDIPFANEDGDGVFYGEDDDENDELYNMRRSLTRWNSSSCY